MKLRESVKENSDKLLQFDSMNRELGKVKALCEKHIATIESLRKNYSEKNTDYERVIVELR